MQTFSLSLLLSILLLTGCSSQVPTNSLVSPQTSTMEASTTEVLPKDSEENAETSSTEIIETPSESSSHTYSIVMVGDVLLHTPIEEASLQPDGSYDYSMLFQNMKPYISDANLALVNQEVIIGGEELGISGYPAFNTAYTLGDALWDTGFDVVCHGTNHALDKGGRGLRNCLSYWQQTHPEIRILGIHDSLEDQSTLEIVELGNLRIALLNYTYGTNGIALPSDMPFGVDYLQEEAVGNALDLAEEMADFTIICPHWGTEYRLEPDANQKKWATFFAAHGADLILGTHPHVIEPIEWIQDSASGNRALVYYSLGNFVNWTSGTGDGIANRMVGGMARIELTETDGNPDTVAISQYGIVPIISHVDQGQNGVTVYPLAQYTEELAIQNKIRLQDSSFSLSYCQNLANQIWPVEQLSPEKEKTTK